MSRAACGLRLTRQVALVYGQRGGKARGDTHRWYVEGESLKQTEIAARLGISLHAAQHRMRKLRIRGLALTWSALKLEKQHV